MGRAIAIKQIAKRAADGPEPTEPESRLLDKWTRQIRSEIQTVGRIQRRNLLPLLAHVTRSDCHYLVYEYMKNGSLRDALADVSNGRRQLDWAARHRITLGIAAGLEYLHVDQRPQIIHRDLKPANILLDDNMGACIANFGLSKEMPDAHTHITSSNVAGTIGINLLSAAALLRYSYSAPASLLAWGALSLGPFATSAHHTHPPGNPSGGALPSPPRTTAVTHVYRPVPRTKKKRKKKERSMK